jgi:ABC-type sulfate transport system substrate-binding protein
VRNGRYCTEKGYLALAGLLLVAQAQATELLNSSYDVSRELFAALNPPFEQQWAKDNNGDKLTIKQSHAGSSKAGAGDFAGPESGRGDLQPGD